MLRTGSKLGFAAVCVVFAAGCSADVSRFDLGNPGVASGYAPSDTGGSSSGSYGRDPSYGSTGSNRNSTAGYTAPRSYGDNTVARQELDVPRETSALPPPTNQERHLRRRPLRQRALSPDQPGSGRQPVSGCGACDGPRAAPGLRPRSRTPAMPRPSAAAARRWLPRMARAMRSRSSRATPSIRCRAAIRSRSQSSCSANQPSSPSIKPGQKLYLPGSASAKAAPRAPAPSYETAAAAPASSPASWLKRPRLRRTGTGRTPSSWASLCHCAR